MILNARAENGSSSEECLTTSLPSRSTPLIGGISSRSRHVLYDCIQKLLYALVPVCGTAAYRNSGTFAGAFSQSCFQLVYRGLLTFQILPSSDRHPARRSSRPSQNDTASASSFISSGISAIEISSPLSSL